MMRINRREAIRASTAAATLHQITSPATALGSFFQENTTMQMKQNNDSFGIASGEPTCTGFVIWTRIPEHITRYFSSEIAVEWWVRELPEEYDGYEESRHNVDIVGFVLSDTNRQCTDASRDFTVKVGLANLEPNKRYIYGFSIDGLWESECGFARTLPDPNAQVEKLRFAYVSCQKFGMGFFTVFQAMAQDSLDFCVHLGDSIYESVSPLDKYLQVRHEPESEAKNLDEYRALYKKQLSDPWYREARRRFTWIYLPDDHEVYNDYSGLEEEQKQRRVDAYRAYFEYTPNTILDLSRNPEFTRTFVMGRLATLIALDLRQYRDPKPDKGSPASGAKRSILGLAQMQWLQENLESSETKWNVLLSSVMMMPKKMIPRPQEIKHSVLESLLHHSPMEQNDSDLKHSLKSLGIGKDVINNTDAWDGFAEDRSQVLESLARQNKKNTLVWTGDIHNLYSGHLILEEQKIGFEMTTGSVTSPGIGDILRFGSARLVEKYVLAQNSHMQLLNFRNHMYVRCTLTPEKALYEAVCPHTIRRKNSGFSVTDALELQRGSLETKILFSS